MFNFATSVNFASTASIQPIPIPKHNIIIIQMCLKIKISKFLNRFIYTGTHEHFLNAEVCVSRVSPGFLI
jgi:hypothetical protein